MRALDDVVLALRALRVPGETALHAQAAEIVPAGEQLVHVALVAGVEDDRVVRRVEDPVDRHREFDNTEVRPEVTAGLGHLGHEEPADLIRQLGELLLGESVEVSRARDRREQTHTASLIVAPGVILRIDARRDDPR